VAQIKTEREKLMSRASTTAMNRLRKKYYEDYRAFYLEELAKIGITIREYASAKTLASLKEEIKRLESLLAEKEAR
jgi:hypothetical protein